MPHTKHNEHLTSEKIRLEELFGKHCTSCLYEGRCEKEEPCLSCIPRTKNWRSARDGHPSEPLLAAPRKPACSQTLSA